MVNRKFMASLAVVLVLSLICGIGYAEQSGVQYYPFVEEIEEAYPGLSFSLREAEGGFLLEVQPIDVMFFFLGHEVQGRIFVREDVIKSFHEFICLEKANSSIDISVAAEYIEKSLAEIGVSVSVMNIVLNGDKTEKNEVFCFKIEVQDELWHYRIEGCDISNSTISYSEVDRLVERIIRDMN